MVDDLGIRADLLLCAGDMCDKADQGGLQYAWEELRELAGRLGAQLVATSGNHDITSRAEPSDFDPKGALQSLVDPRFPFEASTASDWYWARNYAILATPDYRVVSLNSAAFHGHGHPATTEWEFNHGRISTATLERLRDDLRAGSPRPPVNILLCHHHPHKVSMIDTADYSQMRNGEQLLQALEQDGAWFVVHGHRHFPHLAYAAGGPSSAIVFGAGSFSAQLYPELTGLGIRNQFYLVEFATPPELSAASLELAGRFRAWNWAQNFGWRPAEEKIDIAGLPRFGGFGYRQPASNLARSVMSVLPDDGTPLDWPSVTAAIPAVAFALPAEFRKMLACLREDHNCAIEWDDGEIRAVGVPK